MSRRQKLVLCVSLLLSLCCWSAGAQYDVTLVTQSTTDKLYMLPLLCDRWRGAFSLALFLNATERRPLDFELSRLSARCESLSIAFLRAESHDAVFPVNRLRNLALRAVNTTHHLVSDMDFAPSRGLRASLVRATSWLRQTKVALVIPAFQRRGGNCKTVEQCLNRVAPIEEKVPSDFEALGLCLTSKECIVFQSDNSWDSHSTTDSTAWLKDTKVRPLSCFHTNRYEPYVVVPHWPTPEYDERFAGYGKNKIQHIAHLRRLGFAFAVFPREFLLHVPHPRSRSKEAWTSSWTVHKGVDKLYDTFLAELEQLDATPAVHICNRRRGKKPRKKQIGH